MRNAYAASVYEITSLPMRHAELPAGAAPISGAVSESVRLGSDLRWMAHHMHKSGDARMSVDTFFPMEAALYVHADIWQQIHLYLAPSFYGSESLLYEAAALWQPPGTDSYLKVGRFVPAYGWKLPNHSVFIRKQLGFGVKSKETGIEAGYGWNGLQAQIALFNGDGGERDSDDNLGKGVSARLAWRLKTAALNLELGLSGWYNVMGTNNGGSDERIEDRRAGAFAGLSLGRFVWLGEADFSRIDDRQAEAAVTRFASYQELGFLALQGVELVASYELWDDDISVGGNAAHRFGAALELHPWPMTEVAFLYRYIHADPQNAMASLHEALALVHLFF